MTPTNFEGSNAVLGQPPGMSPVHIPCVHCRITRLLGGSLDGSEVITVAWKPSQEDIDNIVTGGLVYLNAVGGIPPHNLTTELLLEPPDLSKE